MLAMLSAVAVEASCRVWQACASGHSVAAHRDKQRGQTVGAFAIQQKCDAQFSQMLLFALLVALCFPPASRAEASRRPEADAVRLTTNLDEGWLFKQGECPGAETPGLDDADWRGVSLPHDWSIEGPFDKDNPAAGEGGFLPTGIGWYRKHFSTPELRQRRVWIEFDGVMACSDVWINGQHLGHRPNGYVSFRYDVSDHLREGDSKDNVVVVRADTSAQVASRWYTGSGVYRHVRLVVADPLHIDYHGVFVTTPEIKADVASVKCSVTLRNEWPEDQDVTLRTHVSNPEGRAVAAGKTNGRIAAGETTDLVVELDVPNPQLWDVESPALYTVTTRVEADGRSRDDVTTPFGIREAEFRSDSGFWLNGRNLKIKGVCLHHDGGAVGAAVPLGIWEHRLTKLRELGVNAVRTSHNPVSPEFLDLCDRMGMLVMDEFFDCWRVGKRRHDYHLYFDQWAHRDARDTIHRDRNHPSIVLYSAGNEIHDTPRPEQAKAVLQGLVELFHASDPTRPVTQGLFRPNASGDYDNGLADMLDVIGTNYRDQELLDAWRDKPGRKIIGTEQGHHRRTWLACRDNPQHAGQFLWVGIDYLGESRAWPVTTFNAGLLDRTGRPHPRGYERQSWWSDRPMVRAFRRVSATEETPTDPGYESVEWKRRQVLFPDWTPSRLDRHTEMVEVYSNCEVVELLLNGESLGSKPLPPDAQPRQWRVGYSPGVLVAIARNAGQEAARHELRTAGPAHHIALSSNHESLAPGWDNVAHLEVHVVDEQGVPLPRDVRKVSFSVEGPGRLISVDCGSIISHEPFQATWRNTHQGGCVALVRATGDPGVILVSAESPGLEAGSTQLKSNGGEPGAGE